MLVKFNPASKAVRSVAAGAREFPPPIKCVIPRPPIKCGTPIPEPPRCGTVPPRPIVPRPLPRPWPRPPIKVVPLPPPPPPIPFLPKLNEKIARFVKTF